MDGAKTCVATFAADVPLCDPDGWQQWECENNGGRWDSEACSCQPLWEDPLILFFENGPPSLTGLTEGVLFDGDGSGHRTAVAWTTRGTMAALLALDRNGNGAIDSGLEIFGRPVSGVGQGGKPSAADNGFARLAEFDAAANGGNGDGAISAADTAFGSLLLWTDRNHDGVSQPDELMPLRAAGIERVELAYQAVGRRDQHGNFYRYRATVRLTNGKRLTVWDVFLAAGGQTTSEESASSESGQEFVAALGGDSEETRSALAALHSGPSATAPGGAAVPLAVVVGVGLLLGRRGERRDASRRRSSRVTPQLLLVTVAAVLWPDLASAQSGQTVEYYHTDALGSVRAVTKVVNGQVVVVRRHDFKPFGEEVNAPTPPTDKRLFTGKERDTETGLDYFEARFLKSDVGLFTTVDPGNAGGNIFDPQSWNAYAYARNNPIRFVDPTGLSDTPVFRTEVVAYLPPNLEFEYLMRQLELGGAAELVGPMSDEGQAPGGGGSAAGTQRTQAPRQTVPNGMPHIPSRTEERLQRLKNCALAYYGFDPISPAGLASDVSKWLLAGGPGVPKVAAEAVGVRVIAPEGASRFTSIARIGSVLTRGALHPVAVFAKRFGGPIAIASAVIDATAIGLCTAMD